MIELSDQEAWDFAQFLKRVGFYDFRKNATDEEEAYRMQYIAEKSAWRWSKNGFRLVDMTTN